MGSPGRDPVELSAELLEGMLPTAPALADRTAALAADLREANPASLDDGAATAFWINTYNALLRSVTARRPFRRSVLLSLRAFGSYAFEIGGDPFTLNLIEHGVLRGNRRPPAGIRAPLRRGDPRLACLPSRFDPRIHFALNCGARSCPPIRIYRMADVESQLEQATAAYLQAESEIESGTVELPGLVKLYGSDFGSEADRLRFAADRLPELASLLEQDPSPRLSYASFDWRVSR